MIEIDELRKGNKVKCKISNDAGIYTVMGIPGWGIQGYGDGKSPVVMIDRCPMQLVAPEKLRPIKLTTEVIDWLEWKDPTRTLDITDDLFIGFDEQQGVYLQFEKAKEYKADYVCERVYLPHINALHRFQNLCYDLSGQEIKFK